MRVSDSLMSSSDTLTPKANTPAVELLVGGHGINPIAGKAGPAIDDPPVAFDRICGNCGYLLIGLPCEGICPECGERYEADELVIPGWAAGSQQSATTAPPGRVWWTALMTTGWLSVQAILNLLQHHSKLAAGYGAIDLAILARVFYRRRMLINDFGCTSHLRLSPRGLGQREGFGPVRLVPWIRDLRITFTPEGKGMYLLAASRPGPGRAYRKGKMQWSIAFQFECSKEEAAALSQILQRYDRNSRRS